MKRLDRLANPRAERLGEPSSTAISLPAYQTWIAVGVLVAAALACFGHTFSYPFVFDDKAYILQKATLHSLWTSMFSSHRPIVDFSFAANYALQGPQTWGYHLVNLTIHIAAALALFGIIRRTLSRGELARRYGSVAWGLGLGVALLWLVHPLQTQSVTYIYQRFESLMGLWFLLTFYCFIRAQDSPYARWWYAGSVASCLLAIGSKEVASVAPLLLLWYDRAFLASSWRELFRQRWPFYAALGGVLGVLGLIVLHAIPIYRGGGMLVVKNITPLDYAQTQPGVILYYLRLAFWPQGQCLDYAWPVAKTLGQIVPPSLVILALLGLTAWCIWRHPAWGFVGGWFFLILAPSSSFIPIRDLAFEHRMYLSLAAVIVAVVLGGYELLLRLPALSHGTAFARGVLFVGPLALVAILLGTATYVRNLAYQNDISLWEDIVNKVPDNPRGHNNLGIWYQTQGRTSDAMARYRRAIELDAKYYDAHYNLGMILANSSRPEDQAEAMRHYEICLESTSWFVPAVHNNMAIYLEQQGDIAGARSHLEKAVKIAPKDKTFRGNLIRLLGKTDPEAAIQQCEQWLKQSPNDVDALTRTAFLMARQGQRQRALEICQQALKINAELVDVHYLLGQLLASDQPQEAIRHLRMAIGLQPRFVDAYLEMGELYVRTHADEQAIACFQTAVQLEPQNSRARQRLTALLQKAAPSSKVPGESEKAP